MEELTPTTEEQKAINSLKRLAKKWPKSLWLFSASGSLCVMRAGEDGEQATLGHGGMDPSYILDNIHGIKNDGGDW
jgi:hypothetical protein